MEELIYKIMGILGIFFIILGSYFSLNKKTRINYTYLSFVIGGIFLLIYSISINDLIFIILQGVFIIISMIEYYLTKRK